MQNNLKVRIFIVSFLLIMFLTNISCEANVQREMLWQKLGFGFTGKETQQIYLVPAGLVKDINDLKRLPEKDKVHISHLPDVQFTLSLMELTPEDMKSDSFVAFELYLIPSHIASCVILYLDRHLNIFNYAKKYESMTVIDRKIEKNKYFKTSAKFKERLMALIGIVRKKK